MSTPSKTTIVYRPFIPVGCLLALTFIILKLTGTISWSWWLVLMPLWLGPAIGLCFMLLGLVATCVAALVALIVLYRDGR